jgi:hypothetical protein
VREYPNVVTSGRAKSHPGTPMTLGNAANAQVRLIICARRAAIGSSLTLPGWLKRYGADTPVHYRRRRLVCSRWGSRNVDLAVTGTEQRRRKCADYKVPGQKTRLQASR